MIQYFAAQTSVVATSLILCIEQVCYNSLNPNIKERVQKLEKELREQQAATLAVKRKSISQGHAPNVN